MISKLIHIACTIACLVGFASGQAQMLSVKSGRQWGIINASGGIVAAPQFDAVSEISERQAVIVKGGKYGLIDSTGRELVAPRYTFLKRVNDRLILINQGGDCQNQDCEGGKWGLIHLGTKRTVEPSYNLILKFDANGLALVNIGGKCGYESCEGGRWGIVDTAAREMLSPQFKQIQLVNRSEAMIQGEHGWGIYDLTNQRIKIQPRYEELKRLNANRITMRHGTHWGMLNARGDTLVFPKYESLMIAGHGYIAWSQNEKYGLMDSLGRIMVPARYDAVTMEEHAWVRVRNKSLMGLSDTTDREIFRPELTEITHYGPGFAIINLDGMRGMIDRKGQQLIPLKYERCDIVNDSIVIARTGNVLKWFRINGEVIKSMVFDSLSAFTKNKVAKAKTKEGWGLLNQEGHWVMQPQYEEVRVYFQAARAKLGEQIDHAYFDEKGHSSKIKRIVIIKEDDGEDIDLLNTSGTNVNVGWFLHSRGLWALRVPSTGRMLIEPTYKAVEVIPGTSITCVLGKIKDSENWAWGLVNHVTGKRLTDYLFESITTGDFAANPYARVIYFGSGKYALLNLDGKSVTFDNAAYIGKFVNGVARVNLGGEMVYRPVANIDTIQTLVSRDKYTNERVTTYSYCINGKWGYVDRDGKWLKPVEYETALDFQGSLARVRIKGKWGAINSKFEVVVEPRYDFIERLFEVSGRTLFAVGQDHAAYGFIGEKGEISIKPAFDEVGEFHNGLVRIRKDKYWGYANRAGEIVIQPQYVLAGDFYEGRARVRNARAWGFIDSLGNNITPQKYLRAGDFREGMAWVQGEKFFGFVDLNGKIAIAPAYSAVGDFSEGLAPARRRGAYGLIDKEGHWVLQPSYYRIGRFHDSLAVIQEKGDFGLISPTGRFVVKPIYKEIADFHEGLARFRNGFEYGYLDTAGNTMIPSQYTNAGDFSCGRATIFVQGKWGFIDTTGAVVIEPQYPKVFDFHEDRAAVRVGDKWGFIDLQGKVVVPIIYGQVADFQDGRAAVREPDGRWGFVNADGTVVIPCEFSEVGFRKNGIISVRKNRKWGLINGYGAQMTPCKYDAMGRYGEGLAAVMIRRSVGVVDDQGTVLLEPHFDTVLRVGNLLQVEDDDAIGYLDFMGKWIWAPTK